MNTSKFWERYMAGDQLEKSFDCVDVCLITIKLMKQSKIVFCIVKNKYQLPRRDQNTSNLLCYKRVPCIHL